jgi:hypothetical protein
MYILLALLDGRIAVWVGHLGRLAQGGGDDSVDEAEDGNGAEGDGDDVAVNIGIRVGA